LSQRQRCGFLPPLLASCSPWRGWLFSFRELIFPRASCFHLSGTFCRALFSLFLFRSYRLISSAALFQPLNFSDLQVVFSLDSSFPLCFSRDRQSILSDLNSFLFFFFSEMQAFRDQKRYDFSFCPNPVKLLKSYIPLNIPSPPSLSPSKTTQTSPACSAPPRFFSQTTENHRFKVRDSRNPRFFGDALSRFWSARPSSIFVPRVEFPCSAIGCSLYLFRSFFPSSQRRILRWPQAARTFPPTV